jgi:putative transposase
MASERLPVQLATRVLHVAESGYYAWKNRPPSARSLRHLQVTAAITGIHSASRGTYGFRRIHAELTLGLGLQASHGTLELLLRRAGLRGLPGNRLPRPRRETPSASDLVDRNFTRTARDQLWVTDITEHPTREGKIYCAVVLDIYSRRVVGWSTNALDMAISNRRPQTQNTIIHSDHGVQFTSWAFTERARPPAWSPPWAPSATAPTTPRWNPSGAASRPNCSTGNGGAPAWSWPTPSSNTSRSSTTVSADTQRSACSRRSNMNSVQHT